MTRPDAARRLVCLTVRWNKTSPAERRRRLERIRPGGILLFEGKAEGLKAELDDLRARLPHPLVVLADLERGVGQQVSETTSLPPAGAIAAAGDPDLARQAGLLTGIEMKRVGIDIALAPVLDVQSPAGSAVIGVRAFGSDVARVARFGRAFVEGVLSAGALPCAKHFPGHGAVPGDSHMTPVTDPRPAKTIARRDLLPYRETIAAGLPAVMLSHLRYPALDPSEPATRSRAIAMDLLRDRLGFNGAVFSDALTMEAVADRPEAETAARAVEAGVDLLLDPRDPERLADALEADLAAGRLSAAAVSRAVAHLDTLARRPPTDLTPDARHAELLSLPDRIALAAVTLLRGPLPAPRGLSFVWIDDDGDADAAPARAALGEAPLFAAEDAPAGDAALLIACRPRMHKGTAGLSAAARGALRAAVTRGVRIRAAVLLGSPWAATDLPSDAAVICAYGSDPASQRAALTALRGEAPCPGRNPFF